MKHKDSDELLKELKNKYTLMSKYYRKFGYDFMQIFMHHDINLENIIKHNLFCEPEKTEEYFVLFENEILITWKLKRKFIYVYENLKEERTMDYKDCDMSMKVKYTAKNNSGVFEEGEILTIEGFNGRGEVKANGKWVYPENIEPLSIFMVEDEVLTYNNEKIEIWGAKYDKEKELTKYATRDKYDHDEFYWEDELQKLKERNELVKGDKFIDKFGNAVLVLANAKDTWGNQMTYFCKIINDKEYEGKLTILLAEQVKEIIYD